MVANVNMILRNYEAVKLVQYRVNGKQIIEACCQEEEMHANSVRTT